MPTGEDRIADLAFALGTTLHHALAMVDAEDFGDDFRRMVQKARLIHGILETRVSTDVNWMADEIGIIAGDTEALLERLEALAEDPSSPEI